MGAIADCLAEPQCRCLEATVVRDRGRREVLSRSARAAITEIPETGEGGWGGWGA